MAKVQAARRWPVGAEVLGDGQVHFRAWAPARRTVSVVLEEPTGKEIPLDREEGGYFSKQLSVAPDTLYRYRLDGEKSYPDPASHFQPQGPHGPSQVIDPRQFTWSDQHWQGGGLEGQIIYEMHIGTFTPEGTWAAAMEQLPALRELGVTVLEVMPVAAFTGRFGWGYDGVDLYAPTQLYGTPDDFRRFVDRAHALQLGVILDVVYNHLGPDGCYLQEFTPAYFTNRYKNEWGKALNFDGDDSGPVREFFIANAGYWIDEFHLDGLRLDATQQMFDHSPVHILTEVGRSVRAAARGRATIIVAENEPQETRLIRPIEEGGYGLDMLWNDDYHHTARTALTGHNEAYYTDYGGTPQELISAAKWGYLYQGQRYKWQKNRRGTPAFGLSPAAFVNFLQNHDQIANSANGARLYELALPGQLRALTAFTLLMPGTPMLFQGQEFASSNRFLYFADHKPELAEAVRQGRAKFLAQFPSIATPAMQAQLPDPTASATFEHSKLDLSERETHAKAYGLHRDLIKLRREDPILRAPRRGDYDGAVLGADAFVLRYFHFQVRAASLSQREEQRIMGSDRLLLVNLGKDLHLDPAPEPLLAPPEQQRWQVLWSSEDPRYGGEGVLHPDTEENWRLPGHAAVLLIAVPIDGDS